MTEVWPYAAEVYQRSYDLDGKIYNEAQLRALIALAESTHKAHPDKEIRTIHRDGRVNVEVRTTYHDGQVNIKIVDPDDARAE